MKKQPETYYHGLSTKQASSEQGICSTMEKEVRIKKLFTMWGRKFTIKLMSKSNIEAPNGNPSRLLTFRLNLLCLTLGSESLWSRSMVP